MEKKVTWLMSRLNNVYCDNCNGGEDNCSNCEECNREQMNWGISKKEAEVIVKEILNGYELIKE